MSSPITRCANAKHKAGGAALRLSCAACFEGAAGVFADPDALRELVSGTKISKSCPFDPKSLIQGTKKPKSFPFRKILLAPHSHQLVLEKSPYKNINIQHQSEANCSRQAEIGIEYKTKDPDII